MTSQPQPTPGSASQYLRPLRDIAAYALVAATGAMLFVAIIRLIPSGVGLSFGSRAQDSFYSYVNVPTIFFPLAAVLLALLVSPQHPKAKLITVIALVEYAVAAVFAIVFGILVGLIKIAGFSVRTAFEEVLVRGAWLAVFAVAAFATYQIWRHLFFTPKPKREAGVYGQPQYGVPGTYPGQPGYGQPGGPPAASPPPLGQPGLAGAGHGAPFGSAGEPPYASAGQPPYASAGQPSYGSPGYGQPHYGEPQYSAPSGYPAQPASGPPAPATTQPFPPQAPAHPVSTQPFPGQPTSGAPPAGSDAPVGGYDAFTEPTQVVPQAGRPAVDPDRTQIVGGDRPAGEDPLAR